MNFNNEEFENNSNNFDQRESIVNIKIIGVGGGGGNAVASITRAGVRNIYSILANTDAQAMNSIPAAEKILLGKDLTKGLGSGSNPSLGEKAALESEDDIKAVLKGSDLVFVAAGMGGGTGTGASPVIAKIAKSVGALVVGVVTTPFNFEGKARLNNAKAGIEKLSKVVDSIIIVSNNSLLKQFGTIPIKDAFLYSDAVLKQAVRTITDLISQRAMINLDFADVKTVMKDQGKALIGIGSAKGENKAKTAAENAISSALLDVSIKGAKQAIINVTVGNEFTLEEVDQAIEVIKKFAGEDMNVVFGIAINESLNDEMIISIIATGLNKDSRNVLGEISSQPQETSNSYDSRPNHYNEQTQSQNSNFQFSNNNPVENEIPEKKDDIFRTYEVDLPQNLSKDIDKTIEQTIAAQKENQDIFDNTSSENDIDSTFEGMPDFLGSD